MRPAFESERVGQGRSGGEALVEPAIMRRYPRGTSGAKTGSGSMLSVSPVMINPQCRRIAMT